MLPSKAAFVAWTTVNRFIKQGLSHWGASTAFYTVLSLPPVVILAASVGGALLGPGELEGVTNRLNGLMTQQGIDVVEAMLDQVNRVRITSWSALMSLVLLLFTGTVVFANTQTALNEIWEVESDGPAVRQALRTRLVSLFLILSLGVLLIASLALTAAAKAASSYLTGSSLSGLGLIRMFDLVLSGLFYWSLFALLYRVLPDGQLRWRDVLTGSLVTASLFLLGRELIAAYLGRGAVGSAYGAASSIFGFLLWVYYSAQLFFLGAVFTKVNVEARGRTIKSR